MPNTANYKEQGGNKWVIGGELEILSGGSVTGITTATIVDDLVSTDTDKALSAAQGKALQDAADAKVATNIADSEEVTAPTTAEFNALLSALKAAGVMVDDE